jgi:hypothetical protein
MGDFFGGVVLSSILTAIVWAVTANEKYSSEQTMRLALFLLLPLAFVVSLMIDKFHQAAIPGIFIPPIIMVIRFWRKCYSDEIEMESDYAKSQEKIQEDKSWEERHDSKLKPSELLAIKAARLAAAEAILEKEKLRVMELHLSVAHGTLFPLVKCRFCDERGQVRSRKAKRITKTISDNSVIGRIVSPKSMSETEVQELNCGVCRMTWQV